MRIELGRDDFDFIVQGLRMLADREDDSQWPTMSARGRQRLETLRERVGEAFTGFLDMDGEG